MGRDIHMLSNFEKPKRDNPTSYTPPHNYMNTPKYHFLPYSYEELVDLSQMTQNQLDSKIFNIIPNN
ncbi:unnamed protein product [Meloidogyne enterolobii]|uniref:Uncharacterized protein n=1 Tax=Meloidogyne enterolobii TaxID=390850 RepID=A0ACB1AHK9_MELEN